MSLELRSYGLRSERLDSDTAGLGVVDGGRCIRVDDVRVGLGVVDAVPGLGVEVVGKADPEIRMLLLQALKLHLVSWKLKAGMRSKPSCCFS